MSAFAAVMAEEIASEASTILPTADPSLVSGIDQALISPTTLPGDNFYQYANERWLSKTSIPADKSDYGIFTILDDRTRADVRELIEQAASATSAPGTPQQKVGDFYRSVLDLEARQQAGLTPIEPLITGIDEIQSPKQLASALARLGQAAIAGPFATYVDIDARNSDAYIVYLTQTGLTLPDRDYYLDDEPRYVELRAKLRAYIADSLRAMNRPDVAVTAEIIVAIETALAKHQWSKTENRDPEKTYNRLTATQLSSLVDGFEVSTFIEQSKLGGESAMVVRQPSYFAAVGELLESQPLDDWKAYLRFRVLDAYAPYLTSDLETRHFEFHGTAVSGIDEQEPLWKRAVDVTSSNLGEVVGQLYVDKYFTAQAKSRMNELVDNLKAAFAARIQSRDWMSEGTKRQALEKLSKFTTKIGYPDVWKDYSKMDIRDQPLALNVLESARFEVQRELDKLRGPIDRNEWHMTPQTINAYYNPTMNEIVFPAAILQPPFFNLQADDAVNYGAIGAVIGHELSHGFDDKGSKYDGDGNLRNWWTPHDRDEFDQRGTALVEQYDQFAPFDDMNVNGRLTLGENIGDLGGLSVAYVAYRHSLNGQEAPVIDGLTGDQRFFLGWAQIWRRLYREPELRKRLIADPHSPSEYRVNGIVRNLDAWYEAFKIPPTAKLYLSPEQRVRIW